MIRLSRGYDLTCAAVAAMFEDRRCLFVDPANLLDEYPPHAKAFPKLPIR